MNNRQSLKKAIKRFKEMGYTIKSKNYMGNYPEKLIKLTDYYYDMFYDNGVVKRNAYLGWNGDIDEILEVLHTSGVEAVWCGDPDKSIEIFGAHTPKPRRKKN